MHSYDSYGWLSDTLIEGRTTDLDPQAPSKKVIGKPWPNFTGVEWVLVPYAEPVIVITKEQQNAPILARLAEIDALSASPRATREAALGITTFLQTLNDEADLLRGQLV